MNFTTALQLTIKLYGSFDFRWYVHMDAGIFLKYIANMQGINSKIVFN